MGSIIGSTVRSSATSPGQRSPPNPVDTKRTGDGQEAEVALMAGQRQHTKHTSSSGTQPNITRDGSPLLSPHAVQLAHDGGFPAPGDTRGAITKSLAMVDQLNKKLTLTKIDATVLEDELKQHIHDLRHSGASGDLADQVNEVDSHAAGAALLVRHVLAKKLTYRVERELIRVQRDVAVSDADIYKQLQKSSAKGESFEDCFDRLLDHDVKLKQHDESQCHACDDIQDAMQKYSKREAEARAARSLRGTPGARTPGAPNPRTPLRQ